ncbi:MAG: acylphosphatase [Nesterenkonia sp.]|uniref:acylphosphatase n=1 Tax=Nesterenkonia marinintestina TaxID=2979865 RepID=UPI0021BDFF8E|nr:acylphosphatase [Nesterenkonia sp. GX14115]MDO5492591.1 acylphosphatase [Nesterenkonia sp.]
MTSSTSDPSAARSSSDARLLRISGRVQGVTYRASAARKAGKLGISGWVRNTDDGDVEALAVGDPESVEEFVSWCGRGPRGARVDAVDEQEPTAAQLAELGAESADDSAGFSVRR